MMLYHRHSLRRLLRAVHGRGGDGAAMRALYDADESGAAAPHTDFVSWRDAKRLFRRFRRVRIDVQNFDGYRYGLRRDLFLSNVARIVGLDLYITADK